MAEFVFRTREGRRHHVILWIVVAAIAIFLIWASLAQIDEVAVGESKVIPSSRSQIIQTLEGGIVSKLLVHEGDIVRKGELLARLSPVQAEATTGETDAKVVNLRARAARLEAEMEGRSTVTFPADVEAQPDVAARERAALRENRKAIEQALADLGQQRALARQQLDMALPLLKTGAANEVEILRIRQEIADVSTKLNSTRSDYDVALKKDYEQAMADLEPLEQVARGHADQLRRTEIRSPARGIVKEIHVNTVGGVVAPGGDLMDVVPLGDQLLIEARISPRDIAFVRPGQGATVKITAYNSSIYGSLPGYVETVSPDTIVDEVDRHTTYYRVFVRTQRAYLQTSDGKPHPIMPGMVASTEIKTGRKSVLSYLVKPLNKASEALRER